MIPGPAWGPPSAAHGPIALLETLLALAVQLLIAESPELLLPPDVPVLRPSSRLMHARTIVALIRETHHALERYRDVAPPAHGPPASQSVIDDLPF